VFVSAAVASVNSYSRHRLYRTLHSHSNEGKNNLDLVRNSSKGLENEVTGTHDDVYQYEPCHVASFSSNIEASKKLLGETNRKWDDEALGEGEILSCCQDHGVGPCWQATDTTNKEWGRPTKLGCCVTTSQVISAGCANLLEN
jgi:hypothetical protein